MWTDVVVFFQLLLDKSTENEEIGEENERALTQKIREIKVCQRCPKLNHPILFLPRI